MQHLSTCAPTPPRPDNSRLKTTQDKCWVKGGAGAELFKPILFLSHRYFHAVLYCCVNHFSRSGMRHSRREGGEGERVEKENRLVMSL